MQSVGTQHDIKKKKQLHSRNKRFSRTERKISDEKEHKRIITFSKIKIRILIVSSAK